MGLLALAALAVVAALVVAAWGIRAGGVDCGSLFSEKDLFGDVKELPEVEAARACDAARSTRTVVVVGLGALAALAVVVAGWRAFLSREAWRTARAKDCEAVQPHLEPGEQIEQLFNGSANGPRSILVGAPVVYLILVVSDIAALIGAGLLLFVVWFDLQQRIVAVTNRSVVLLDAGRMRFRQEVRRVISRHPRDTALGPPAGALVYKLRLGEATVYVHRNFWKEIEAADAARMARAAGS